MQKGGVLDHAPKIVETRPPKEFIVEHEGGKAWSPFDVFVVAKQVPDPLRKGWFEFEFIGRAAVVDGDERKARLVLYKSFKNAQLADGLRVIRTGDPLTADEMDLMRKEVLGILQRDKELEDLYSGVISVKLGFYRAGLLSSSTLPDGTAADINAYKRSNAFFLLTGGVRWWTTFVPALGLNYDFAWGQIPTTGFLRTVEMSTQLYHNPGILYRARLLVFPSIYSLTFFMNQFQTTNPDDFLISSSYSGPLLSATFYYPYPVRLFGLGKFAFVFNNVEAGGGIAPVVFVSDGPNYKRGQRSSGMMLSANAGVEFNLAWRPWRFTRDLFFVFEGGLQSFNLSFEGPTTGTLPTGEAIPEGVRSTEFQYWYGLRIKYNFPDFIGELLQDL